MIWAKLSRELPLLSREPLKELPQI